jgi:hypothetical protein
MMMNIRDLDQYRAVREARRQREPFELRDTQPMPRPVDGPVCDYPARDREL